LGWPIWADTSSQNYKNSEDWACHGLGLQMRGESWGPQQRIIPGLAAARNRLPIAVDAGDAVVHTNAVFDYQILRGSPVELAATAARQRLRTTAMLPFPPSSVPP